MHCKLPLLLFLLLLSMPELQSTHGPQSPSNMWSLPQDVTIVTDPPRAGGSIFTVRCWEGGVWAGPALVDGGCDTINLINILYGPPGLWR